MVVCDYRLALQSATASLHAQIDAVFGGFDLAGRDGLTRFLTAQAIGMRACLPLTSRFARHALCCDAPDYRPMLARDLAILGIDAGQLPQFALVGDPARPSWDAGVFYVVAGSRMGAAVLRRRATAMTPAGPASSACGYFEVGEGPAMWRLFRDWLAREERPTGTAPDELADMIDAAIASFQLFATAAHWAAAQPSVGPAALPLGAPAEPAIAARDTPS